MTSITIGAVLGGGELAGTLIDRSIRELRFPQDDSLPVSLNVVFHIPGSIVAPDYVGTRTGRFSRKEKMLMVQVAVPKEVVYSADCRAFLWTAVRDAVLTAVPFFQKKKIGFPLNRYLEIVDEARTSAQDQ